MASTTSRSDATTTGPPKAARASACSMCVARRLASEEPLQDHYHRTTIITMVLELIAATGDPDALDQHFEEMREMYARYQTEIDSYTRALYEHLRHRMSGTRRHTSRPIPKRVSYSLRIVNIANSVRRHPSSSFISVAVT